MAIDAQYLVECRQAFGYLAEEVPRERERI